MANSGLRQMIKLGLRKKLNLNPIESENPSDFVFAKNGWNPTTFGFELCHISSCNDLTILCYCCY